MSCFPAILLSCFLNDCEMVPVVNTIAGTASVAKFHMWCIYTVKSLYFKSLLLLSWSHLSLHIEMSINPLTPNDPYRGRTATLTSKRCILYIYSTNIGAEYFKHGIYSPIFFSSKCSLFHNSNVFGSYIIHILYTGRAKIKKKSNSGA